VTGGDGDLRRADGSCITEITSSRRLCYSLPEMLVPPSHAIGWADTAVMSAFPAGLLVSAVAALVVGRLLDLVGPQSVMTAGFLARCAALLSVPAEPSARWLFATWMFAGRPSQCCCTFRRSPR
jgi:MFS family permease